MLFRSVNVPYVTKNPQSISNIKTKSPINVFTVGKQLFISSNVNDPVQFILVYDLHGRLLLSKSGLNVSDINLNLPFDDTIVIVKVQTNSFVNSKKISISI